MTARSQRRWRYEVTDVWGSMVGRLAVGDVVVDRWKPDRCWEILDLAAGEITGGWSGRLLNEFHPAEGVL